MKVAIYARVSKTKQELENQIQLLSKFAKDKGYEIYKIYKDIATGKNADRDGLRELKQDAWQGKFDIVLVFALDRLTREGMVKTVSLIEYFTQARVGVLSYSEPYLDTTNELVRNLLIALLSSISKAEREKISERTKAGLERARRQGKKIGRPPVDGELKEKALKLLGTGKYSLREIANKVGVSHSLVAKWS